MRHIVISHWYVACDSEHIQEVVARFICSLTAFFGFCGVHLGKYFDLKIRRLDDSNPLLRPGATIPPCEYLILCFAPTLVEALELVVKTRIEVLIVT